jgi:hypothetical protein
MKIKASIYPLLENLNFDASIAVSTNSSMRLLFQERDVLGM